MITIAPPFYTHPSTGCSIVKVFPLSRDPSAMSRATEHTIDTYCRMLAREARLVDVLEWFVDTGEFTQAGDTAEMASRLANAVKHADEASWALDAAGLVRGVIGRTGSHLWSFWRTPGGPMSRALTDPETSKAAIRSVCYRADLECWPLTNYIRNSNTAFIHVLRDMGAQFTPAPEYLNGAYRHFEVPLSCV